MLKDNNRYIIRVSVISQVVLLCIFECNLFKSKIQNREVSDRKLVLN